MGQREVVEGSGQVACRATMAFISSLAGKMLIWDVTPLEFVVLESAGMAGSPLGCAHPACAHRRMATAMA